MRILLFSDIHSDLKSLERLLAVDADYYIAAGDLVSWAKGFDRVGPMLARRADRMYVIPGNHESEADIAGLCERHGLQPLHGQSIKVGSHYVGALGYSNRTPFHTPGEYTEEQLTEKLEPFASLTPLILVCHCPPKGTLLDRAAEGIHYGSPAVKRFIEQHQPVYFFCGHIHEAEGVQTVIGKTKAVNVGKRGFLLEVD
jgi:Icc-related predicted phosphoesterase